MPHVSFVTFAGLRVHEQRLLELGLTLPGLGDRAQALSELPALGLITLAGMTPAHWSCDYTAATGEVDTLVQKLIEDRPTIVAISALTASILEAYAFSDQLRDAGLRTVIGGLHATTCPDEAARHADAVVVGSGESVWHALLHDAERDTLRPRYDAHRAAAPLEWPTPRFDLLGPAPPRFTVQTERGCPFACEFCGASRLLGSFQEKPIDRIRTELQTIAAIQPRPWIELADDNTWAGSRDPEPLFAALSEVEARYFTESDWRIGERPDVLQGLAKSGCVQVLVGIESTLFRYPGMGKKQAELDRMLAAVEAIQQAGVVANGCFILGAEGETDDSIDRLIEFLLDSPFAELQLTLQTPFPGTRLYDRLKQSGRLLSDRDWSHYTLFDVTYRPDQMSVEALEAAFQRTCKSVFGPAAHRRRNTLRRQIWKQNPTLNKLTRKSP